MFENADPKNIVLGASRGLGRALCLELLKTGAPVLGISRKEPVLQSLAAQFEPGRFEYLLADLSRPEQQREVFDQILAKRPSRVFYVAGGGPHGLFATKKWADHQWALEVNSLAPMRLAHELLRRFEVPPPLILCGSAVAEAQSDPQASSYAAAKHALRGFFSSVAAEYPHWDVRLFSPGYMDTELLPKGAPVRYKELWSPSEVAKDLLSWALDDNGARHKVEPLYPVR